MRSIIIMDTEFPYYIILLPYIVWFAPTIIISYGSVAADTHYCDIIIMLLLYYGMWLLLWYVYDIHALYNLHVK